MKDHIYLIWTLNKKFLSVVSTHHCTYRFACIFLIISLATTFEGQSQSRFSTSLEGDYDKTISDATLGNNPWSLGLGVLVCYKTKTTLKPTIELTGDLYLEDDKIQRYSTNGQALTRVNGIASCLAGTSFQLTRNFSLQFLLGPSLINGAALITIKPSASYYFASNHRWAVKVSYLNVLNRENQSFSSVGLSVCLRLF